MELEAALRRIADDPDARAVVLRGEGPGFCAGADIRERDEELLAAWPERRRAAGRWARVLDQLEALPQPTVVALHGAVIGGGALLGLAGDIRIARDDVRIAIPEISMGIPLTWGGIPRMMRELGASRTRELLLTGRDVGATEALAIGFVHQVLSTNDFDAGVAATAEQLAANRRPPSR